MAPSTLPVSAALALRGARAGDIRSPSAVVAKLGADADADVIVPGLETAAHAFSRRAGEARSTSGGRCGGRAGNVEIARGADGDGGCCESGGARCDLGPASARRRVLAALGTICTCQGGTGLEEETIFLGASRGCRVGYRMRCRPAVKELGCVLGDGAGHRAGESVRWADVISIPDMYLHGCWLGGCLEEAAADRHTGL